MEYHKAASVGNHIVLETYLDADNALAVDYVQQIQAEAAVALAPPHTSFRLWCPNQFLEWSYASPKWFRTRMEHDYNQKQQALAAQRQQQQNSTTTMMQEESALPQSLPPFIDRGYFIWKSTVADHKFLPVWLLRRFRAH
jgi:hypothetical protein